MLEASISKYWFISFSSYFLNFGSGLLFSDLPVVTCWFFFFFSLIMVYILDEAQAGYIQYIKLDHCWDVYVWELFTKIKIISTCIITRGFLDVFVSEFTHSFSISRYALMSPVSGIWYSGKVFWDSFMLLFY